LGENFTKLLQLFYSVTTQVVIASDQ